MDEGPFSADSLIANFALTDPVDWQVVDALIPWRRQTSTVAIPASCSFKTAMICSLLNLLRFISVRRLGVGFCQKGVIFQGSTSTVDFGNKAMTTAPTTPNGMIAIRNIW